MWMSTRIGICSLLTFAGLVVATSPALAAPATTGHERFDGFLEATSAADGRQVLASQITARGFFAATGRIVEIPSRPGDAGNVNRDDLVFPQGRMHLKSVNGRTRFTIDAKTCLIHVTVSQTGTIEGGTGALRQAAGRFTGRVDGRAVVGRGPDGHCAPSSGSVLEVDVVTATGTLTF